MGKWLASKGVPGLCDVDTRALTFRLREGVTLGRIVQGVPPFNVMAPLTDTRNLVAEVSIQVSVGFFSVFKVTYETLFI